MYRRSRERELLDANDIPLDLLHKNLQELDFINRFLGGHATTIAGIKKLVTTRSRSYHIIDYGCGGGDTLRAIRKWGVKNGFKLQLTGIDINPGCISYAIKHSSDYDINFREGDCLTHQLPDHEVAVSSLVCHHLYDQNLEVYLKRMVEASSVGVVINDLHRHTVAHASISLLTKIFSSSPLVKNDAPASVRKSFQYGELKKIVEDTVRDYYFNLQWKWAFRYLVTIKKEG